MDYEIFEGTPASPMPDRIKIAECPTETMALRVFDSLVYRFPGLDYELIWVNRARAESIKKYLAYPEFAN